MSVMLHKLCVAPHRLITLSVLHDRFIIKIINFVVIKVLRVSTSSYHQGYGNIKTKGQLQVRGLISFLQHVTAFLSVLNS